ncbi:TldD/PmbA family protein [Cupriavidus necator]
MTDWKSEFMNVAQCTLDVARRNGASAAVAQIDQVDSLVGSVRNGIPNERTIRQTSQLRVTLLRGHRAATVSSSDLSPAGIKSLVARGMDIAKFAAEDPFVGLPEREEYPTEFPDLDLTHPWELDLRDAVGIAKRIEQAALGLDPAVPQAERSVVASDYARQCYANTDGFVQCRSSTSHSYQCQPVAIRDGEKEVDFWSEMARDATELPEPEEVGRRAAERALKSLGARQIQTQSCPVLFDPLAAASLLSEFIQAVSATPVYMKASFLAGLLGEQCFSEHISLVDDPHLKRGAGSAVFDSDGVALRRRAIVENGYLKSYCLGLYGARRMGLAVAEHTAGPANLSVLSQFTEDGDDLTGMMRRLGTGLLVTGMSGHGVNVMTGDFSRAAHGFWVEGGEIQFPVAGVTVASNLKAMFRGLVAVGNDSLPRRGITTGSWLIDTMRVGGS